MQFVSTLLHEIAHALLPTVHHGPLWLQTCGYLNGLISHLLENLCGYTEFTLCAAARGANITRHSSVTHLYDIT